MGWEWRVFFENSDGKDDVFSMVADNGCHFPERRTDVYKPLGHPGLGLKVRGELDDSFHELKIRMQSQDDGWEQWTKKSFAINSVSELKTRIVDILEELQDEELSTQVNAYLRNKADPDLGSIQVRKCRVQVYREDAVLEQTDLKIVQNNQLIGNYRTICVDGNRNSVLPKQILDQMGPHQAQKAIICGYPEFLERLAAAAAAAVS